MESAPTCYLPNNPSYLQEVWKTPQAFSPFSPQVGFIGSPESKIREDSPDFNAGLRTPPVDLNMNSFSFSSMDVEPLTSFFPFGACPSPYKDYQSFKDYKSYPHESDVYFSVKHPLMNSNSGTEQNSNLGRISPLGSLTHSVYNPGISRSISLESSLCSQMNPATSTPVSTVAYNAYPQIQMTGSGNVAGGASSVFYSSDFSPQTQTPVPQGHSTIFPAAMSVNLSMNMTMGVPSFGDQFLGTASAAQPSHVQWATTAVPQYAANAPSVASSCTQPMQMQYSPSTPPQANGSATGLYTFTAEFRQAPTEREFPTSSFYPCTASATVSPSETPPVPSKTIFKPKFRTIPTGRAACFPALSQEKSEVDHSNNASNASTDDSDANGNGKVNLCRICGKTYARPSTLKTHMRTHSGERPYRCMTCHKSFSQAANLTAHVRTHSGEKPFRCPVCDRKFSQSSSVTTHMRTHSGERPYRCCMCKKSFSDSSTLTKHLRIHSGEKPYQCKLCLLRFSQSGNLNRHMRVHTD